jgi:hypothetical protein
VLKIKIILIDLIESIVSGVDQRIKKTKIRIE